MYKLTSHPVFENVVHTWPRLTVAPAQAIELVSIHARQGQEKELQKVFKKAYGAQLPAPTGLVKFNQGHVGWIGPYQWLMQFEYTDAPHIDKTVTADLAWAASVTLQSDAWVGLDITGDRTPELLERLFSLDTSDANFPTGSIVRTQMHHMGVILLRYPAPNNSYRLLSARSSAQSFLHAITQTAKNIRGDQQ